MTETTGTVIQATHRPQDLIPAFLDELRERDSAAYAQLIAGPFGPIPGYAQDDDGADWWQSAAAEHLLESLAAALDAAAPEGCYFGAHPGDGSDFGFWEHGED